MSKRNRGRASADAATPQLPVSSVEPTMRTRRPDDVQPATLQTDGPAEHLQLLEERLHIAKESIDAGKVRVGKRVTEWTETLEVPLRREDLVIEVLPGSGIVRIEGNELQAGDVFELTLVQERAIAQKETVVSEDVNIRKISAEVEETVEETLRREELVVDEDGDFEVTEENLGQQAAGSVTRR